MNICPRCGSQHTEQVAASPVAGVWTVHMCSTCIFTWRSTEPEHITNPDKYLPAFKVDQADIPKAAHVPPIPARRV
ncbi:non-oxidative hydroxyarylic acid decarboxylases subunit D [Paenibacillus wulumuqiensis]|uniref:non-oxidative hydroxyarylic acid decarboxylases subunit D n=1 Tax=Paenibacillus wulumuqiensis TaxID=1567107 RepID=UPI0006191441|nr:non-oxidative hydroxyarylic acid decarboxylases subunit D [Paenibacillus wulumuqiensis]